MAEALTASPAELNRAFVEYERPVRVRNYKLGCLLAMVFMPAGASLDFFVYGTEMMWRFLPVRIISAALLLVIWLKLHFKPGSRDYRAWGFSVAVLPMLAICWMIYLTEGAASPYYAGLNLVMLGAAILLRWTFVESLLILVLTLAIYVATCFAHGPVTLQGVFFNNLYFLFVTGVFIIAGTWFYNRIRWSEFELRYRLDQNRAELQGMNEKLESSNNKLRELDEVKNRFFANISHELRTPLTLLIAPLEILVADTGSLDRTARQDLLATMHGNAMRLLKLINDLLDLVRLESGRMQVRRIKVGIDAFVRGLANSVKQVAEDKRISVQTICGPNLGEMRLDVEKLERICLNLLFNALKFTPAGGSVDFKAVRDNGLLRIDVRDTGMGIAPDQLPHIFDRFWQADTSSQRKFQGMGIGLALVKELAEVQGGSVSVASELGKGTIMTVKLPVPESDEVDGNGDAAPAAESESATTAQTEPRSREWIGDLYRRAELFPVIPSLQASLRPVETGLTEGRKPRLLIADDEPDMLRFLVGQFGSNYDVIEAVDGAQAVEKAAQFLPDIFLCDMMMPQKDGLQVCRELRERTSTRNIPVVLLTARADERTKLDCLSAGASDFMAKPFSLTELSVRLKNLVDNRLYQKEMAWQKQQLEAALEQVKETESLLVRNEKLASLGRLSAGLIHEINNPLNYASQGLYHLGQCAAKIPETDRALYMETVNDVKEGVNRVVRIVSDLRGFTRTDTSAAGAFDLKSAIETSTRFFGHRWKDGIGIEVQVPEEIEIMGDRNQFIQVMVNLTQNALDALENKHFEKGETPLLRISATASDGRARLKIWDNGPGIPKEIQDRIFDPFFTTKDVGQGMGLGLSISHRIISEHGGQIQIRSEPGRFSEFTLDLPAAESATPSFAQSTNI